MQCEVSGGAGFKSIDSPDLNPSAGREEKALAAATYLREKGLHIILLHVSDRALLHDSAQDLIGTRNNCDQDAHLHRHLGHGTEALVKGTVHTSELVSHSARQSNGSVSRGCAQCVICRGMRHMCVMTMHRGSDLNQAEGPGSYLPACAFF